MFLMMQILTPNMSFPKNLVAQIFADEGIAEDRRGCFIEVIDNCGNMAFGQGPLPG